MEHRVSIFNRADFDVDTSFVSRCRDGEIAYLRTGGEWEPIPARLDARELRLQSENSFEFREDLAASGSARPPRMSQVLIRPWRRRLAPAAPKEFPFADGLVHNVRIG